MTGFHNNSVFWVEVEKIHPNPYQPRREFDEDRLKDLADSIRQYGVLQPLTVTRKETIKEDGGLKVEYELIAGERRLRASKLAALSQVPVIIRSGEENDQVKLELAIIENLQREDINPMERAEAFKKLADEFNLTHTDIAKKVGKSREFVSNTIRLMGLPEEMQQAVRSGHMSEGHARSLLMLKDKPEEQKTLFKEVVYKKLTVRETESIARRVARDKVRKKENKMDPEIIALEKNLSDSLGTRVHIQPKDVGGQIIIDFFSAEDVRELTNTLKSALEGKEGAQKFLDRFIEKKEEGGVTQDIVEPEPEEAPSVQDVLDEQRAEEEKSEAENDTPTPSPEEVTLPDEDIEDIEEVVVQENEVDTDIHNVEEPQELPSNVVEEEKKEEKSDEDDLYSISRFSI